MVKSPQHPVDCRNLYQFPSRPATDSVLLLFHLSHHHKSEAEIKQLSTVSVLAVCFGPKDLEIVVEVLEARLWNDMHDALFSRKMYSYKYLGLLYCQ